MKPLSAVDAITPAFTRTHKLLFDRPLRFGRIWKLCASSYLAYCGSIFIPYPLFLLFIPHDALRQMPSFGWFFLLLPFAFYLALFYFANRMEFVEFELLVTLERRVAPAWRRYGGRTWPWILAKVVVGAVLCSAMAPAFIAFVREMITVFSKMSAAAPNPGAPPDPAQMAAIFSGVFTFYGLLLGAMLVLKVSGTILGDFILPFYAIENISLLDAMRKGLGLMRAQPLQTLGFVALKYLLALLGYVMLQIGLMACMIPLMIIGGIVFFIGALIFHAAAGVVAHLLLVAGIILVYVVLFALLIAGIGYLLNLLSSFAIYFMGGRFKALGDYLEPPPPSTPYTPPPIFPSPEERHDDEGGPTFPMDPALA